MDILVVGGGGREHAIIKKLRESPEIDKIYCLPGNGGIAADAVCVPIGAKDIDAIAEFAAGHGVGFAVVAQDDPLALPFVEGIRRPDRDNAIDVYLSDEWEDVLRDGVWQTLFTSRPEPLTAEEKKAWIATQTGLTVGSDAFFPFGDNVERARKSGVQYIAEPGGSIRDDHVIATADKYGMVMAFTGMRLFHH